jgi:hypothetical protein
MCNNQGTLLLIKLTYERHGVEFDIGNGGVRLKASPEN